MFQELHDLLGPQGCLTGADVPEAARSDGSRSGQMLPLALLRPATVEQVSAALAICHRHGQKVVVQGGMTGLAGGANALGGEVALSLSRLSGVEEIDAVQGVMVLRAGTVLEVAQRAAEAAGFLLPIDLGARGSCQIGGNIATNAGGLRVIRHGTTRENVLGLEVVQADGTVLSHLNRAVKDNTGYDLRHLFAGSEGTLGVITRAVLRLRPLPAAPETALCALEDFGAVVRLLQMAQRTVTVAAFEAMWREYFALSQSLTGKVLFADVPPFAVILEAEGGGLQPLLEAAFEEGVIFDALVAQSTAEARDFWAVREGHALDASLRGLINLDVSLPVARMADYADDVTAEVLAQFPGAHVSFFGHVGDSNLHVAIAVPDPDHQKEQAVDRIAYDAVRARGGSISAEHGIGTLKRDWLGHSRSPAELAAMRAIKAALDPKGILNPGKVI